MSTLETSNGIFEIQKVKKAMISNGWLVYGFFYRSVGSCLRADENRKAESGGDGSADLLCISHSYSRITTIREHC